MFFMQNGMPDLFSLFRPQTGLGTQPSGIALNIARPEDDTGLLTADYRPERDGPQRPIYRIRDDGSVEYVDPQPNTDPGFYRYPRGEEGLLEPDHGVRGQAGRPDYVNFGRGGGSPALSSQALDPRTGKLDYWGWLDAGAKRLGTGGTILEDDTPDLYEREGLRGRPTAMTAAGNPENARMPEESAFGAPGRGAGTVEYAAAGGDVPSPSTSSGGGTEGAVPGGGRSDATPASDGTAQQDGETDPRYAPVLDAQTWKLTPPGQGVDWKDRLPKSRRDIQPQDPHAYDYSKVAQPPDTQQGREIRTLMEKYAQQYNVPVQLMFNKASAESGGTWKPGLTSSQGAGGLLQLMPDTAKKYEATNRYSLEDNIKGGTAYMADLLTKAKGDPILAEIGYNAGDSRMFATSSLPKETYHHLQKVFPGHRSPIAWQRMPSSVLRDPRQYYQAFWDNI